ncbi:F-box domain [Dillenia turbinata]|uniref:F-box domain n=1 Tax=Dillenia turbinata TaxID=194707 RepID=A0AAN8WJV7_9MAGN
MEWDNSWTLYEYDDSNDRSREFDSYIVLNANDEDQGENNLVSINSVLPDELLERILACLPMVSIFRVCVVCRRWKEIVQSRRFLHNMLIYPKKPWYFMFTSTDEQPTGYLHDPMIPKWYSFEIPNIRTGSCLVSSSCGLVCFMDNNNGVELYVCNPMTKGGKMIVKPPGFKVPDYCTLAMSADYSLNSYIIAVVRSNLNPSNIVQWDFLVQVYDSQLSRWLPPLIEHMDGWRGGAESVICDGVLYLLVCKTTGNAPPGTSHGLVTYDLSKGLSSGMGSFIHVPCWLTCGRLMNLNNKLVLVGGIGRQDRMGVIKGIGIWTLNGEKWEEISRMPPKYFQGFGELDDVFASTGHDDTIFIQSYGSPALLMFQLSSNEWKWSQKCPVIKRFPLHLFTGFCFQPRLDIVP